MKCPYCLDDKNKVIDKRNIDELDSIRRRRECLACGRRFTTYERIELTDFSIIKKDGRRETFEREKLMMGLLKACEKRAIPREQIERIATEIEAELRSSGDKEIASSRIGEMVMERLINLDKVAYIRFASVYREFTDLKSFEKELKTLMKKPYKKQQNWEGKE